MKVALNPALIALAYESGLGEKNSLGVGMLESLAEGVLQRGTIKGEGRLHLCQLPRCEM